MGSQFPKLWNIFAGTLSATRITLDGWACLLGAFFLLTLPISWIMSAMVAAAVHECCHLLGLFLTKKSVFGIHVGISGMEIQTPPLDSKTELLCAAAGPAGSFALLLLVHQFPRIALCAGIQGFFNLIPVFPLDGGRVLRCAARMLLSEKQAAFLSSLVEKIFLMSFCILACVFSRSMGFLSISIVWILVLRVLERKRPCKESKLAVQ